jgi:hypothetical protein
MVELCQIIAEKANGSFCCEGFGVNQTTKTKRAQINHWVKELEKLTRF